MLSIRGFLTICWTRFHPMLPIGEVSKHSGSGYILCYPLGGFLTTWRLRFHPMVSIGRVSNDVLDQVPSYATYRKGFKPSAESDSMLCYL